MSKKNPTTKLNPLEKDSHWTCPNCGKNDATEFGYFELSFTKPTGYVEMRCSDDEDYGCGFMWNVVLRSEGWLDDETGPDELDKFV